MNRVHFLTSRNNRVRLFSSIAHLPASPSMVTQLGSNAPQASFPASTPSLVSFHINGSTRFLSTDLTETYSHPYQGDVVPNEWQTLFGVEYEHPWSGFKKLENPAVDKSSRFLIQQLQDLYNGIVQPYDRPTTEQCNKIINDLIQSATDQQMEQYAFRADAILQCMQLFLHICPNDSFVRLPYPLPLPDRTTYVNVLTLYSKTKHLNARKGPLRCHEIVNDMKRHSSLVGDLTLHPIAHDYNKILLAWGTCISREKAFQAASLLQTLKQEDACDATSYTHVLRACAFSKFDELEDTSRPERLAARIAVKVYRDMVHNKIECTAATYSYFLRACTYLDDTEQSDELVQAAFENCRTEGKVDETILVRLKTVASPSLWQKLMGRLAEHERVEVRDLPLEWTRNVETVRS